MVLVALRNVAYYNGIAQEGQAFEPQDMPPAPDAAVGVDAKQQGQRLIAGGFARAATEAETRTYLEGRGRGREVEL